MSACGKEAGAQNADLTNRNHVARHGVRGKLARGSKAQKGLKQRDVNVTGIAGKLSHLIRGGLARSFFEPEVSRSRNSRWGNDHPGRLVKANYRAKGRTEEKLCRKEHGHD